MKKVFFRAVILAFVILLGMMILGCEEDNGGGGGGDGDWINVTSLAQINGTWKGIISYTHTQEGINYKQEQEMTYIINASTKTVTMSAKSIATMSGFSNDQWTLYTSSLTPGTQTITEDGITYTVTTEIDTTKRTITLTSTHTPQTQTLTDADIAEILSFGWQISRDGRRWRTTTDDPDAPFNEIIFYKQ